MADNVLQPARRSISRRVLMLTCVLCLIVGLSLVAERAGFIAWDLQPVGASLAQTTQKRTVSDTDCANAVIDQPQEAFATDALFVRSPCNTEIVAQRIATARMLRPTSLSRSDDVLVREPPAKPVKPASVALTSDVQPIARDISVADLTPQNVDSNRDLVDEIDLSARTLDVCDSGDGCSPDDPTDETPPDEVVEHHDGADDGDDHHGHEDDADSGDSSHGGGDCDDHHGGGEVAEDHHDRGGDEGHDGHDGGHDGGRDGGREGHEGDHHGGSGRRGG